MLPSDSAAKPAGTSRYPRTRESFSAQPRDRESFPSKTRESSYSTQPRESCTKDKEFFSSLPKQKESFSAQPRERESFTAQPRERESFSGQPRDWESSSSGVYSSDTLTSRLVLSTSSTFQCHFVWLGHLKWTVSGYFLNHVLFHPRASPDPILSTFRQF